MPIKWDEEVLWIHIKVIISNETLKIIKINFLEGNCHLAKQELLKQIQNKQTMPRKIRKLH